MRAAKPYSSKAGWTPRFALSLALSLCLVKLVEFWVDPQGLVQYDSGGILTNAEHIAFFPARSYTYSRLLRYLVLPFHSFGALVAVQLAMGAVTAWILAMILVRGIGVGRWIAAAAAIAFAVDPVQLTYEHLLMSETATLCLEACLLAVAAEYLRYAALGWPALGWLVPVALLSTMLAASRTVYLPVVLAAAVLLPFAGWWLGARPRPWRALVRPLCVSGGLLIFLLSLHEYRTSQMFVDQPHQRYIGGLFLLAQTAPIVRPTDSPDPRVANAVREQDRSAVPLRYRMLHLWSPRGLVARLMVAFDNHEKEANRAARALALAAIRRDPIGYVGLAAECYFSYWHSIPLQAVLVRGEHGATPGQVSPGNVGLFRRTFGVDVSRQHEWRTPTRKYGLWGRSWYTFLLLTPLPIGLALALSLRLGGGALRTVSVLFVRDCLLFTAILFGATEPVLRYLHPFSFTSWAALAILAHGAYGKLAGLRDPGCVADGGTV